MPRIKPARTLEEINAVPQDKSVTISLEPEGTVVLDKEADEAALKAQQEADALKAKTKAKTDDEDSETTDLKKQLDDLRKANEASNKRVQEEIAARQAAEQRVKEREQEASQSKIRAEDAEYDAILNAIGAAESEAEGAQRDIALSTEASDSKGVAEASRRLARAESKLSQLEDGKLAIERAKTLAAERAKTETTTRKENNPTATVDQYIDQIPNLLPSQRDWLKEHPETLTDARKNQRLQGAHVEAEDKGFRPGSTKYFNYLEERLGYKDLSEEQDDDMEDNDPPSRATVSAPPSRNATNPSTGRASNTRITLTPEQREIARLSGVDELTYARQLQKLQQLKADGHYSN